LIAIAELPNWLGGVGRAAPRSGRIAVSFLLEKGQFEGAKEIDDLLRLGASSMLGMLVWKKRKREGMDEKGSLFNRGRRYKSLVQMREFFSYILSLFLRTNQRRDRGERSERDLNFLPVEVFLNF